MRDLNRSRHSGNSSTLWMLAVITKPWYLGWMALALSLVLCTGRAAAQTPTSHDGPATLELKRLVAANPELKRLLIATIEQARQVNPDRLTNPAQSLEQYYEFVSYAERAIPGSLLKARADATLYRHINQ